MFRLGRCGAAGAAVGAPGAPGAPVAGAAPFSAGGAPSTGGALASTSACGGGWRGGPACARGPVSPWLRGGRSDWEDSLGRRSEGRPAPW